MPIHDSVEDIREMNCDEAYWGHTTFPSTFKVAICGRWMVKMTPVMPCLEFMPSQRDFVIPPTKKWSLFANARILFWAKECGRSDSMSALSLNIKGPLHFHLHFWNFDIAHKQIQASLLEDARPCEGRSICPSQDHPRSAYSRPTPAH